MSLLPKFGSLINRGTFSMVVIAALMSSSELTAALIVPPYSNTQSSVTGGQTVDPPPGGTVPPLFTESYPNGFTVSGGFYVQDTSSVTGDVTINLITQEYFSGRFAPIAGTYEVSSSIASTFADLGSSGTGVGDATSVDFSSATYLLDSSNSIVWGSSANINLTESLPNSNTLQGAASSNLFNFAGGNAIFEQDTTITFHNVAPGDILYFNLPNGGTLNSVPEPTSFALLGLGGIGSAIAAYRRRKNVA